MPHNLDLTALRAFVTVVDAGGVTRAAGLLHLTQSAVSMQVKRLEEFLGQSLFLRQARRLALSPEGEQLLSYARRMLVLNDEALSRLSATSYSGEIRLGVPHDVVYPAIPAILRRMAQMYPRVRLNLTSSFTLLMKRDFAAGDLDVMLGTEEQADPGGEVLGERNLLWVGAPEGTAWQRRPLRLGFKDTCIFRPMAQAALDRAEIPWETATGGDSEPAVEATVAADLATTVRMEGALPPGMAPVPGDHGLPPLGRIHITLYRNDRRRDQVAEALVHELRCAYA